MIFYFFLFWRFFEVFYSIILFFRLFIYIYIFAQLHKERERKQTVIEQLQQINCYLQSLSSLSHDIGNWENTNEISMLATSLNRLRLYCVATTIQCSTKDLGNWLIFLRWQGGSYSEMSMRNVSVYNFWDAFRIRDAVPLFSMKRFRESRAMQFSTMYVCAHVCLCYYGSCELSGSANLFEVTTTLFIRFQGCSYNTIFIAHWYWNFTIYFELSRYEKMSRIYLYMLL